MDDTTTYSNETIKLCVLAGAMVVFLAVGYFRFFHKGNEGAGPQVKTAAETGEFVVPSIEIPGPFTQINGLAAGVSYKHHRATIRDIFEPSVSSNKPVGKGGDTPADGGLKLQGAVIGSSRPLAIINNSFVRQGEWINGYRIVAINRKTVELSSGRKTLTLEMKTHE